MSSLSSKNLGYSRILPFFVIVLLITLFLGQTIYLPTKAYSMFDPFADSESKASESCEAAVKDVLEKALQGAGLHEDVVAILGLALDKFAKKACEDVYDLDVEVQPSGSGGYVRTTVVIDVRVGVEFWNPSNDWDYCLNPLNLILDDDDYSIKCYSTIGVHESFSGTMDVHDSKKVFAPWKEVWISKSIGKWGLELDVLKIGGSITNRVKLAPIDIGNWKFDHWSSNKCSSNENNCGFYLKEDSYATAHFAKLVDLHIVEVDQDGNGENVGCSYTLTYTPSSSWKKTSSFTKTFTGSGTFRHLYSGSTIKLEYDKDCPASRSDLRYDHAEVGGTKVRPGTTPITFTLSSDDHQSVRMVYWRLANLEVAVREKPDLRLSSCRVDLQFTPPAGAQNNPPDPDGAHGPSETLYGLYIGTTFQPSPTECGDRLQFDHWEYDGSVVSKMNPTLAIQDRYHRLTAIYWQLGYLSFDIVDDKSTKLGSNAIIKISVDPPDGTVRPLRPSGDYSNGDKPKLYLDSLVEASPKPLDGYKFDHWTGACSGTDLCSFKFQEDATIGAVYWKLYDLDIGVFDEQGSKIGCSVKLDFSTPEGALNDPPEPDGSYQGGTELKDLYRGTNVDPEALPCSGYRFDHWELDGKVIDGDFDIKSDMTLNAVYWKLYDLGLEVVDERGNPIGCKVKLDFEPPEGVKGDPAPDPDGVYSHGSQIDGLYRDTKISPSPVTCKGYRFDHWELDGSKWRGGSFDMSKDRHLKAVFWKQYDLKIVADPYSSGETTPYQVGVHKVDRGTKFRLRARPFSGYELVKWTVNDGDIYRDSVAITMDRNYEVVVHFGPRGLKILEDAILRFLGSLGKLCSLSNLDLTSLNYRAVRVDEDNNMDLLSKLSGPAARDQSDHMVVLGGPDAIPYEWENYGIVFQGSKLSVGDASYKSTYGKEDYTVILYDCNSEVVRIAGITSYGTRAGLMWLLSNSDEQINGPIVILKWTDANANGSVDLGEIHMVSVISAGV